jgi:hypothetical protein
MYCRTDASTKTKYSPIDCTPAVVSGIHESADIVSACGTVYSALAYQEDHRLATARSRSWKESVSVVSL